MSYKAIEESEDPKVQTLAAAEKEKKDDLLFSDSSVEPSTWTMLNYFMKLAIPAIITCLMTFGTLMINTTFAGRFNDPALLASVGLCNVCCNVMVLSLLIGLNSAQETLTS